MPALQCENCILRRIVCNTDKNTLLSLLCLVDRWSEQIRFEQSIPSTSLLIFVMNGSISHFTPSPRSDNPRDENVIRRRVLPIVRLVSSRDSPAPHLQYHTSPTTPQEMFNLNPRSKAREATTSQDACGMAMTYATESIPGIYLIHRNDCWRR